MGIYNKEEVIREGKRTYFKVNNKYYTLYKLASMYNIPYATLRYRVYNLNVPHIKAIQIGKGQERNKEYENGMTIQEMASDVNKTYNSFYAYANTRNLTLVEAYNKLKG